MVYLVNDADYVIHEVTHHKLQGFSRAGGTRGTHTMLANSIRKYLYRLLIFRFKIDLHANASKRWKVFQKLFVMTAMMNRCKRRLFFAMVFHSHLLCSIL